MVPYMRYGHSTVLIDDTVFLWGGRNDTEGACNVLYAFDVSEYAWQGGTGGWGPLGLEGDTLEGLLPFSCLFQILTSGPHPVCRAQSPGLEMDIRLVSWTRSCISLEATSSWYVWEESRGDLSEKWDGEI